MAERFFDFKQQKTIYITKIKTIISDRRFKGDEQNIINPILNVNLAKLFLCQISLKPILLLNLTL